MDSALFYLLLLLVSCWHTHSSNMNRCKISRSGIYNNFGCLGNLKNRWSDLWIDMKGYSDLYITQSWLSNIQHPLLKELKELKSNYTDRDLSYNNFVWVSCGLSRSTNLKVLHIPHRFMDIFRCDLSRLTRIYYLHLSYDKLNSIPCELFRLPDLRELFLSHNNIETIDCDMSTMSSLTFIDLSHNRLKTLPVTRFVHYTNNATLLSDCNGLPIIHLENTSYVVDNSVRLGVKLDNQLGKQFTVCTNITSRSISSNSVICKCKEHRFDYFHRIYAVSWNYTCEGWVNLRDQNVALSIDKFTCAVPNHCPEGCSCDSVPRYNVLRVTCRSYNGQTLPRNMPALPRGSMYELDFTGSILEEVPFRNYLVSTRKMILSNSFITNITIASLEALAKNVRVLHIDNNLLQQLPEKVETIRFQSLVEFRLDNNPWHCDCDDMALRFFLMMKYTVLTHAEFIRCRTPPDMRNKTITGMHDPCQKETGQVTLPKGIEIGTVIIIAFGIAVTLLIVGSVSIIVLRYMKRKETESENIEFQSSARVEYDDEGREFDVFMSYATEDEEYVGEWLIPELERRGFKVCFHRVHFLGGLPIHVNMHDCITKSKRTLAFFSKNFLESHYSRYEFHLALCLDIDAGTKRLVTIKETGLDLKTLDPSYASYFQAHTYIEQEAVNFWENLILTLPQNRLGKVAEPEVEEHAV